jgi:hypothetical protein
MTHTSNNLQILHFDTIGQWGVQTPSSVFYKSGFHPFNLTLSLPNQISKVKKIYLKSVELPVGFTNIRDTNTSNLLSMSIANVYSNKSYNFNILLPNKNYTSIQALLTDINNAIAANPTVQENLNDIAPPYFTVSGQKVSINVSGSITFSFNDTILSKYILGFSWNFYIFTGSSYEAASNYNIVYDTYIIMNFPKLSAKSTGASQQISFKIPYNATYNQIYFDYENTSFSQFIELTDTNAVIGNLQMTINDRFGNIINNNGLDFSFSLAFLTD